MRRFSLVAPLFALAAASIGTLSCDRDAPINVVLITVDTLRADRLGYAGGRDGVSPAIDALAAEGVVFTNAFSASGWTLPSIATILTGRYPHTHGATTFNTAMDPALPTIATLLADHGYVTAGFVSHMLLQPAYGVAKGFDHYDDSVLRVGDPHEVATAEPLTDLALAHLATLRPPFFLWVHYFDPHFDYLTYEAHAHFGDEPIDRYDQEIAHTDEQIGRLLDALARRVPQDETVVLFTADHGEEFGDHGGRYHFTLYDEVVRVPFIIRSPGQSPRTDDRLVEQVDVLPTLVSLLGIDDLQSAPGDDLLAPPPDPATQSVYFARDRPPGWSQRGVRTRQRKLIVVEPADTTRVSPASIARYAGIENVVPGVHLFHLDRDPMETTDVFSPSDDAASRLLDTLGEHLSGGTAATREVTVDDELSRKLRSLGYIQ